MAKTSLEKSHSVFSNSKLTLLCIFASILVFILWIGIASIKFIDNIPLSSIIIAIGAIGSILSVLLFQKFKR